MAIRFMAHAALLALCAGAAAPALGQDYRSSGFERPRGADAMLQHSGGNRTLRLVLIGLVGAAVGAGVEELLDNGDGDPSPDSSDYTPPPVG